ERAAGQVLNRFIAISGCIAGIGARRAEASGHSGGCMLVGSGIIISSTGEKVGSATAFEGIIAAKPFENVVKGPAADVLVRCRSDPCHRRIGCSTEYHIGRSRI